MKENLDTLIFKVKLSCNEWTYSTLLEKGAGTPEWRRGLRHSIAVLAVPLEILVRVEAR